MDPISSVPTTMNVVFNSFKTTTFTEPRSGELITFPDGSRWFTWKLSRGRSFTQKETL
jgi:hypothetical protein